MSRTKSTRRAFLKNALGTGAGILAAPYISTSSFAKVSSANEAVAVLAVGVRARGAAVAIGTTYFGRVVACCDVDTACSDSFLAQLSKYQKSKPDVYKDYRKALERNDVDVVTIGTPDHWHTKMVIDAVKAGKDVYVEKPMTLTIDEGKLICRQVMETGRVVQVGTQQRSEYKGMFLKAVALARNGRLGKKLTATVTVPAAYGREVEPFSTSEPPKTLDWDMWLGQASKVPYCRQRCHGSWRNWLEYGCGPLTDWGVHHVDIAQWALGAENTGPLEIEASGTFPLGRQTTLDFLLGKKAPQEMPNCYNVVRDYKARLSFANGNTIIIQGVTGKQGVLIEGENGSIFVNRDELTGSPVEQIEAYKKESSWLLEEVVKLYKGKQPDWDKPVIRIADIMPTTHMENFIQCIRDRSQGSRGAGAQPISDVFTHHRANSSCLLANIAILLDRKLKWDPQVQDFIGDEEASALLSRKQRAPYTLST